MTVIVIEIKINVIDIILCNWTQPCIIYIYIYIYKISDIKL